jgi:glutathione peroxidase
MFSGFAGTSRKLRLYLTVAAPPKPAEGHRRGNHRSRKGFLPRDAHWTPAADTLKPNSPVYRTQMAWIAIPTALPGGRISLRRRRAAHDILFEWGFVAMAESAETVYEFSAPLLDGRTVNLGEFKGQVLLIVNTASQCGFTPQYAGLEELFGKYKDRGLEVLGFPCNQFGAQEPGSAEEIGAFCEKNYGVSFPIFAKIDVNGPDTHPLYRFLKGEKRGIFGTDAIKWNFTKFLVDRRGKVVDRYGPSTEPKALAGTIEGLLDGPA